MGTRIDEYRKMVENDQDHAPVSELINLKFTAISEGKATFELEVEQKHLNSEGVIQGGILTIMADAAMGLSFGSLVDKKRGFATMELKISFLKPVMKGHLIAIGEVIKKGKRAGFTECKVYLNSIKQENLVSKASSTLIII